MTAIQTEVNVQPGQELKFSVAVPATVTPGKHKVTVIIDEDVQLDGSAAGQFALPIDSGLVNTSMTFRREEIYGDDGR